MRFVATPNFFLQCQDLNHSSGAHTHTCNHFVKLSTPGRNAKPKRSKGRPAESTSYRVVKTIRSKAANPLFLDNCRPSYFTTPPDLSLCASCLISWVEESDPLTCPLCESLMDEEHIRATSTCVSDVLKSLLVRCPFNCKMIVRAENYTKHIESPKI